MRRLTVGLICALVLPGLASRAGGAPSNPAGPSFDCARAVHATDRLLCADPGLAAADRSLAAAFQAALDMAPDYPTQTRMRDAQRAWLADRDRRCVGAADPGRAVDAGLARTCLARAYADRRAAVERGETIPPLETAPGVTILAMDEGVLDKALAAHRRELSFYGGRFSPDGRFYAFVAGWPQDGYAGAQVWLYEMGARRLVAATPPETARIRRMGFGADDVLYVEGERTLAARDGGFRVAATLAGGRSVATVPQGVLKPLPPEDYAAGRVEANAQYVVAARQAGDAFELTMRRKGERKGTLVRSAFDSTVLYFAFDPLRSLLYYSGHESATADQRQAVSGVVVYDLKTTQRTVIPASIVGGLDAITPDGRVIAYAADACRLGAGGAGVAHNCFLVLR